MLPAEGEETRKAREPEREVTEPEEDEVAAARSAGEGEEGARTGGETVTGEF